MEFLGVFVTNLMQSGGVINDNMPNPFSGEFGELFANCLQQEMHQQSNPDITMFTERYLIPAIQSPTLKGFSDTVLSGLPDLFYIAEQLCGSLRLCGVDAYNKVIEWYAAQISPGREIIDMLIPKILVEYPEFVAFLLNNGIKREQIDEFESGWNSVCTNDAWILRSVIEEMRED